MLTPLLVGEVSKNKNINLYFTPGLMLRMHFRLAFLVFEMDGEGLVASTGANAEGVLFLSTGNLPMRLAVP